MSEALHADDWLMRYLDGELSPEELHAFEARLSNDAVLRQQLEQLQVARIAVQQWAGREKVNRIHREMMASLPHNRQQPAVVRPLWRKALAVAASLILVVLTAGGFWLYSLSGDEVYANHLLPYQLSGSRGSEDASVIKKAFSQKDYATVVAQAGSPALQAEDSLLIGLSHLQRSDLGQSETWLSALAHTQSNYRPDAEYYLAFTYLKQQRYADAVPLLQKIRADQAHLYHAQVSSALLWKVRALAWKK
jgi:hypothetical protein